MYFPPELADYLLTLTILLALPTCYLLFTKKNSPLRSSAIACMLALFARWAHPVQGASTMRTTVSAQLLLITVQAANLLLINPLDEADIAREMPQRALFRSDRFIHVVKLLIHPRAIGTPRQIKNVPQHPKYYAAAGEDKVIASSISRGKFLTRQIFIFVWLYLMLDLMQEAARQQAFLSVGGAEANFTRLDMFVSPEKWVERGIANLITWFVTTRILIDASYRCVSIVFVGLGLDTPENWPPAFGRMKDVYTIRNFWGKFWHQFLRGPFTAVSNFVARDVLRLPRPSVLERYTNIFIVFFLSGILHVLTDRIQSIPFDYSGAIIMFPITAFGIMFEDGVQELWKRFNPPATKAGSSDDDSAPLLWQRVVGYIWTLTWLAVISTYYFYPIYELPGELTTLVPLSLTERVGLQPLGPIVLAAGLVVGFVFGAEI